MGFLSGFFGPKTDYRALLDRGAIVIDVRTPEEFKSGHVVNSTNYPLAELNSRIAELKKKRKPIIAICRSGARSSAAASMLKNAGMEAYNGGGWIDFEKAIS
jgi:rhodanese-related sulfurtransferase